MSPAHIVYIQCGNLVCEGQKKTFLVTLGNLGVVIITQAEVSFCENTRITQILIFLASFIGKKTACLANISMLALTL